MAKVTLDWYRFGHLLALLLFAWIGSRLLIDHFELNRLTAYGISTTIVTSASNLLIWRRQKKVQDVVRVQLVGFEGDVGTWSRCLGFGTLLRSL